MGEKGLDPLGLSLPREDFTEPLQFTLLTNYII